MKTEFEIVFTDINRDEIIGKIKSLWGVQTKKNTLMKRVVFDNPIKENSYVRVRDEWDNITCTYKEISSWKLDINSVKELETVVENFDSTVQIFEKLWLKKKSIQESYREVWQINNEIEFMIDLWPGLKPFIEIEWETEEVVMSYSKLLGFKYSEGLFWSVDQIYLKELNIKPDYINNLEVISFEKPPKK